MREDHGRTDRLQFDLINWAALGMVSVASTEAGRTFRAGSTRDCACSRPTLRPSAHGVTSSMWPTRRTCSVLARSSWDTTGQDLLEYAALAGFIALMCISGVLAFGLAVGG